MTSQCGEVMLEILPGIYEGFSAQTVYYIANGGDRRKRTTYGKFHKDYQNIINWDMTQLRTMMRGYDQHVDIWIDMAEEFISCGENDQGRVQAYELRHKQWVIAMDVASKMFGNMFLERLYREEQDW